MSLSKPVVPQFIVGLSVGCPFSSDNNILYSLRIPYTICKEWATIAGSVNKYNFFYNNYIINGTFT